MSCTSREWVSVRDHLAYAEGNSTGHGQRTTRNSVRSRSVYLYVEYVHGHAVEHVSNVGTTGSGLAVTVHFTIQIILSANQDGTSPNTPRSRPSRNLHSVLYYRTLRKLLNNKFARNCRAPKVDLPRIPPINTPNGHH